MYKKNRGKKQSRKKEKMKIKQRKKKKREKIEEKNTLIFQGFVANTLHIKNKLLLLNQIEFQKSFSHSENIVPKKTSWLKLDRIFSANFKCTNHTHAETNKQRKKRTTRHTMIEKTFWLYFFFFFLIRLENTNQLQNMQRFPYRRLSKWKFIGHARAQCQRKKKKRRAFFCPSFHVRIVFLTTTSIIYSFSLFFLSKKEEPLSALSSSSEISFWAPPPSTFLSSLNASKSFLPHHLVGTRKSLRNIKTPSVKTKYLREL